MDPSAKDEIQAITKESNPCDSFWLQRACQDLLHRDLLDAAKDAQRLADLFERRRKEYMGR